MAYTSGLAAGIVVGVTTTVAAVVAVTAGIVRFVFGRKRRIQTLVRPDENISLKVIDREDVSHDTIRLKLALPSGDNILGTKVGQHVYLMAIINGEKVIRPYTPVSMPNTPGYVEYVIKVYRAGTNPKFPQGGKMSQYLESIPIGHRLDCRGPAGNFIYTNDGSFTIKLSYSGPPTPYQTKHINMVAGGTGITPMYQMLKYILDSPTDTTKISLLFANQTEKDILLRDDLELLRSNNPNQFRLWYTVAEPPSDWSYSTGFVDETMMLEHLYPPGDDTFTLLCGPPAMVELALLPALKNMNYTKERIFTF